MADRQHKRVKYNSSGHPIDCLFCRIHQRLEPGTIVFEDDEFVVFRTIAPASNLAHLLVTPREHIRNIKSLSGPRDAELVEKLVETGRKSLNMLNPEYGKNAQFSFHIPPWNSIDHLHLHAIALPKKFFFGVAYSTGTFFCTSAESLIEQLRQSPDSTREPIHLYQLKKDT